MFLINYRNRTGGAVSNLDYFYYSLVTISTVGYGDIHPVSALAKVLTMSEAFVGTITFALVVGCILRGLMAEKGDN